MNMFTEQKVQSLIQIPRINPSDFIKQFSHLGRLNCSNYNPQLFETIGNHSHVRCLALTNLQPTKRTQPFVSITSAGITKSQVNKLTKLTDTFG